MEFTAQEKRDLIKGQTDILVHLQKLDDSFLEIKKDLYGTTHTQGLVRICSNLETFQTKYETVLSQQAASVSAKHFWMVFAVSILSLLLTLSPVLKGVVTTTNTEQTKIQYIGSK